MSTVALPARGTTLRTLASTDHKRIALAAGGLALVFFLAGGLLALVMRTQLAANGQNGPRAGRHARIARRRPIRASWAMSRRAQPRGSLSLARIALISGS